MIGPFSWAKPSEYNPGWLVRSTARTQMAQWAHPARLIVYNSKLCKIWCHMMNLGNFTMRTILWWMQSLIAIMIMSKKIFGGVVARLEIEFGPYLTSKWWNKEVAGKSLPSKTCTRYPCRIFHIASWLMKEELWSVCSQSLSTHYPDISHIRNLS